MCPCETTPFEKTPFTLNQLSVALANFVQITAVNRMYCKCETFHHKSPMKKKAQSIKLHSQFGAAATGAS